MAPRMERGHVAPSQGIPSGLSYQHAVYRSSSIQLPNNLADGRGIGSNTYYLYDAQTACMTIGNKEAVRFDGLDFSYNEEGHCNL